MPNKIYMNARMAYINKPKEYWETKNPILEDGEMGFVSDVNENEWCKVGDGRTPWNNLPWKKGPKGDKGDAFVYTDFTEEQLEELSGSAAEEVEKDLEENTEFVFYGGDATASSEPLTKTKCYRLDICDELPDGADLNNYLNTGNWNLVAGYTYLNCPAIFSGKFIVQSLGVHDNVEHINQTIIDFQNLTHTRLLRVFLDDESTDDNLIVGSWTCTEEALRELNTRVQLNTLPATESVAYPGCYYRKVGDEDEWINPPMVVNTEYRTTERHIGNVLYTKIVNFDSADTVEGNCGLSNVAVVRFHARTSNFVLPRTISENTQNIEVGTGGQYVYKQTSGLASQKIHLQVWYYKK